MYTSICLGPNKLTLSLKMNCFNNAGYVFLGIVEFIMLRTLFMHKLVYIPFVVGELMVEDSSVIHKTFLIG